MALYNNGFPVTYPQMYQPYVAPQAQQQAAQQPQQSSIIWVSGEAGAKAYMVAPNNTVQLWDSEAQVIYLKSADASGMPSMKVLDYTIRDLAKNVPSAASAISSDTLSTYATKDEIKAVSEQIAALRDRVDTLSKRRTRGVTEDE